MKIFPKFIFLMTGYCLTQTPGGLMTGKQFQALKSRPADYRIAPAEVPQRYSEASAIKMLPLGVAQTMVWGRRDDIAPISLGERYVEAARQSNERVQLLSFADTGHFEIATPLGSSWPALQKEIAQLLGVQP
jgi:pimeloyl-ACP methyl ester carboxylesterase